VRFVFDVDPGVFADFDPRLPSLNPPGSVWRLGAAGGSAGATGRAGNPKAETNPNIEKPKGGKRQDKILNPLCMQFKKDEAKSEVRNPRSEGRLVAI
jgi:hypothetical protein